MAKLQQSIQLDWVFFYESQNNFKYYASPLGEVFSVSPVNGVVKRRTPNKLFYNILCGGRHFDFRDLMIEHFLPQKKEGQILTYIDGNNRNLAATNLKWDYPQNIIGSKEPWKWVSGFEGKYIITQGGKLFSVDGKWNGVVEVGGSRDAVGYHVFSLRKSGKKHDIRRHCLIAKHFIHNPENKKFINHKNGVKGDDRIENLEWVTPKENLQHAVEIGLHNLKGTNHPHVKLTNEEVIQYRWMSAKGMTHQKIADVTGKITRRQITDVINGKNWGWLSPSVEDCKRMIAGGRAHGLTAEQLVKLMGNS